jgi:predicted RNase H-like nuclease (RuvC/YqgF family)
MSEPIRYGIADNQAQRTLGGNVLVVDPAGRLVEYADYARLKAEVAKWWNTHMPPIDNHIAELEAENARLKAEVNALRKELAEAQENYHLVNEMVAKILKEGKPQP